MNFGGIVVTLRKEQETSQDAFAGMIGVHVTNLSKYECNEVVPSVGILHNIADILDVSLDYLKVKIDVQMDKDILSFPKDKQEHILFAFGSMIKATKLENI